MKKLFLLTSVLNFYFANAQVQFDSTNLPIILIDTQGNEIVDEPKIQARMKIIFNDEGKTNHISDSANIYNDYIGIEIRGSSSQMFPKKAYSIETRDSSGEDNDVSLLGFPEESDWVLYAPYSDKTLLRNVLAYKFANNLGRYASHTKFCEVFLNGDYIVVYVFMEKIKRDKNRVDIKKLEPEDNSGDALTGGYLLQIDRVDETNAGWYSPYKSRESSNAKVWYVIEYPKGEDIIPQQVNYIKNYITDFESTMNSSNYNNLFTGYYDYININTFVDFYLVNEFCKNVDAYRLSTFLYKDRDSEGGKLSLGPVWDFNLAFGNADYDHAYLTSGWEVFEENVSSVLSPFWTSKLMNDPVFLNAFKKRWNEVKNNIFNYDSISNYIDSQVNFLQKARERNFEKWPVIGQYVWPNYYIGNNYEDEINYLKNFISNRINWIDSALGANYGDIIWEDPDLTGIYFEPSQEKKLPFISFYHDINNIDSVIFVSQKSDLKLMQLNDSLIIFPQKDGSYNFRAAAYLDGNIISVSPLYNINVGTTGINEKNILFDFNLYQNYPNPFNPETVIKFSIKENEFISLKIYNMLGETVAVLINNKFYNAGDHKIKFTAGNLVSGIYIAVLESQKFSSQIKMILLK